MTTAEEEKVPMDITAMIEGRHLFTMNGLYAFLHEQQVPEEGIVVIENIVKQFDNPPTDIVFLISDMHDGLAGLHFVSVVGQIPKHTLTDRTARLYLLFKFADPAQTRLGPLAEAFRSADIYDGYDTKRTHYAIK